MTTRHLSQSAEDRRRVEAELLARIARRDEAALSDFYDLYSPAVYALALRILGNASDADEAVGDVFWQVWEQASRFDPDRGGLMAWLMTIARSRSLDLRRRTERDSKRAEPLDSHTGLEDASSEATEQLFFSEIRGLVRQSLTDLPESHRIALEYAYYEGMSHSQIARALNAPLGTVKTWLRKTLIHLREDLQPLF